MVPDDRTDQGNSFDLVDAERTEGKKNILEVVSKPFPGLNPGLGPRRSILKRPKPDGRF